MISLYVCYVVVVMLFSVVDFVVVFLFLFLFSPTLQLGLWVIMYIIFIALIIGNWTLLCNHNGYLPILLSLEGFYCFLFSIKFCFNHKKK